MWGRVNIVGHVYRNARSRVRVNRTFSNDFLVQVGSNQDSVLSPLFTIALEAHLEKLGPEVQKNCSMQMT